MAKFSGFRTFRGSAISDVVSYLSTGLALSLKELQAGLSSLSLTENFNSQIIDVWLPGDPNQVVGVPHNLGVIPSQRIILKMSYLTQGGPAPNNPGIDDSENLWTNQAVYFRNLGDVPVQCKILLLR